MLKRRKIRGFLWRMGFASTSMLLASIVFAKGWLTISFEEEADPSTTIIPAAYAPASIDLLVKNPVEPGVTALASNFLFPVELDIPSLTLTLPFDLAEMRENAGFDSLSLNPFFDNNLPSSRTDYAGTANATAMPFNGLWAASTEIPTSSPDFGITPLFVPGTGNGNTPPIEPVPEPGSGFMVVIGAATLLATFKFRRSSLAEKASV